MMLQAIPLIVIPLALSPIPTATLHHVQADLLGPPPPARSGLLLYHNAVLPSALRPPQQL